MDRILPRNSRKRLVNIDDIGSKGFGLYRLAKLSRKFGYKVPDFFIVPTNYAGPEGNITLRARYLDGEGNYAVRSSSPFEDSNKHSFAGIFKTHLDVPRSDLIDAIRDVKDSASSEKAKRYAQERGLNLDDKMAVIVQRRVEPDAGGMIYSTLPSTMRFVRKALGIGALVLALAGCDNQSGNYHSYVDLNGDKRQEVVTGNYGQKHWNYVDYDLTAKISNSDGSYGEPKLLMRFKDEPDHIYFTDLDGDGDLDLVFSKYGHKHWGSVDYDTFVAKNDGKGNFGEPELINRQQK